MQANQTIRTAFVSTNSITQGEQVGAFWPWFLRSGGKINFAHRTFEWSSEARGKAAVHCVIIGFALEDDQRKWLFEYETIKAEPHAVAVSHINPYLVEASDVVLLNRRSPISGSVPELSFGSMPNDDGHLLMTAEERAAILRSAPGVRHLIRPFLGSVEYINDSPRYCLWLVDASPAELRQWPEIAKRVGAVRANRLESDREATRHLASTPALFGEIRQPKHRYLAIPKTSSERRAYIPMGFLDPDVIASTELFTASDATLYHFGILTSTMHMAWVRAVCGRLKSDYRYSAGIVYNNFPWPDDPTDRQRSDIEGAAQRVLDARAHHSDSSLADLYDPLAMPADLSKAHSSLDRSVDVAYGKTNLKSEAERVSFLFVLYEKLTSMFQAVPKAGTRRRGGSARS